MKEFKINEYLNLKLEGGLTKIYIAGDYFNHCKYLLINIPHDEIEEWDRFDSIDEVAETLDHSMEGAIEYNIPPETEFWAHCSNIQTWVENGYDTRLLHKNLAFEMLYELTKAGDRQARRVFKEEVAERFQSGHMPVMIYLLNMGYFLYFTREELLSTIDLPVLSVIRFENPTNYIMHTITVSIYERLGLIKEALEVLDYLLTKESKDSMLLRQMARNYYVIYFHLTYGVKKNESLAERCIDLAISLTKQSISLDPKNYSGLNRLAMYLTENKQIEEACKYLNISLQIDKENPGARWVFGKIEHKNHNYVKAIAYYKQVLEVSNPSFHSSKDLYNDLAESCYLDKQYKESLKWAKNGLEIIPDHYESLFFLGVGYHKQGMYSAAIKAFGDALIVNEVDKGSYSLNDLRIRKTLYKAYLRAGHHEKALNVIKAILLEEPNNKKFKRLHRKYRRFG